MPHEFQTDFPILEAQAAAMAILTKKFDMSLFDQAWIVAEYAARQAVHGTTGVRAAAPPPVSDEEALHHLHDYATDEANWVAQQPEHEPGHPGARARATGFPLPWGQLAILLIDACAAELKKYLAAQGG